jgi:transaldolase / glucose-6-phosphate isomerase
MPCSALKGAKATPTPRARGACDYDRAVSEENPPVRARLPADLRAAIDSQLQRAVEDQVEDRLRSQDATLWGPVGTPEVANRLGWLTIAQRMSADLDDISALADELSAEEVEHVVVLGMGGSSLAPEVIRRTFAALRATSGQQPGRPRLHVLDSTNAAAVRAMEREIDPRHTLFLVSSKSGGTIEPLSMFAHFWSVLPSGEHFAAITDPGSGLEKLAGEHRFRRVFDGDPDIGGRYSALSPFGIVPAALSGVDAGSLLAGAQAAWQTPIDARRDVAAWLWLGAALSALAAGGRDKLTICAPASLDGLGLWLEQLFAESTGKHGKGILPVADEPLLGPESYGEDRVFLALTDPASQDPEAEAALRALASAGHPLITIPTHGPRDLGRVFMLSELCVAVAGWGLSINPFDQPNVQEAKDATANVLAKIEAGEPPARPADATAQELRDLLGEAAPPSYVALMGYMKPSAEVDAAIAELRAAIMQSTKATTTFGYGPRFLHSTGQFHKGGPPIGRFLQLLHDQGEDVPVPGKAYTFTSLEHAQADGDLQTLRAHGLPAARITIEGSDPAGALRTLAARVRERSVAAT